MLRFLALFALTPGFLAAGVAGPAPARAALAMPEAVASYRIGVRYDPATHELTGRAAVTWYNTSPEPVPDLQLHLYWNAFKNLKSTFVRERVVDEDRFGELLEGGWGWIDITSLRLEGGQDLADRIEFIAPDDGNRDDRTVARVALPRPVAPGDPLRFTIEFHARAPRAVDRSGWARDFVMAAQWFPKLGVYEPAGRLGRRQGGWNCHQFHASSEFYSDFGDYDVQITVPRGWTIGATGERVDGHDNVDGTVSERFVQRGVHDFAWTASPRFEVHERAFQAAHEIRPSELAAAAWDLDRTLDDVALPDVQVTVLAFRDERRSVERTFRALFAAIKYFGLWYGPYPYDRITVVIPPHDAEILGGMEYPTLFLGSPSFMSPPAFQSYDETLVHEFGHQYWYGIVATNEFEESWLDEGFVSYSTARVMDLVYGPRVAAWDWAGYALPGVEWHRVALPWRLVGVAEPPQGWETLPVPWFGVIGPVRISDVGRRRMRYLARPASDDLVRKAWEFRTSEVYGTNSYSRPATVLATLERLVGHPGWARVMRAYAENYRFKHPTSHDVLATLETVTRQEWEWFFEHFVWGHRRLDYAVAEVTSDEVEDQPGVYGQGGQRTTRTRAEIERSRREMERQRRRAEPVPSRYRSEVVVERRGDAIVPVEVKVFFSDSAVVLENWDGRYQWTRFRYDRFARVDSARVDPDGRWLLDTDRLNNSRARQTDRTAARRWTVHWMLWVQSFLQLVGWLA